MSSLHRTISLSDVNYIFPNYHPWLEPLHVLEIPYKLLHIKSSIIQSIDRFRVHQARKSLFHITLIFNNPHFLFSGSLPGKQAFSRVHLGLPTSCCWVPFFGLFGDSETGSLNYRGIISGTPQRFWAPKPRRYGAYPHSPRRPLSNTRGWTTLAHNLLGGPSYKTLTHGLSETFSQRHTSFLQGVCGLHLLKTPIAGGKICGVHISARSIISGIFLVCRVFQ